METRVCTKCGPPAQPIENFGWKSRLRGKRHAVCKTCTAKRSSDWYYANREHHIQNVAGNSESYRRQAKEYIWEYLSTHPCIDCGERDPIVLEFDHRGAKTDTIAHMVGIGISLEKIKREVEKCEVRCANCHRKKTTNERGWFRGNR